MDELKVLNGRVATERDVEARRVIFFIPDSRSTPFEFDHAFPLLAKVVKKDDMDGFPKPGSLVTIVQAEMTDEGQVVLGLIYGDGEEGVCHLQDIEVIGPIQE